MNQSGLGAGDLFERVQFESPSTAGDGYGGTHAGFTPEFTVRAAYRRLKGSEAVQAARLQGKQPTIIAVRSSTQVRNVTTDWRIVDARSGEIFNIRSASETRDRAFVEFLAESGVAT